jgi:hypothetical protein
MSKHDDEMIEINEEHKRMTHVSEYIERWCYIFAAGIVLMCALIFMAGCVMHNPTEPCGDLPPVYGTDC